MLLVQLDVQPADLAAFHRWYEDVHIPELLALPGFRGARRFEVEGEGIRFLAIYELESIKTLQSPEYLAWRASYESERRVNIQFTARSRHIYRTIFESTQP